MDLNFICMDLYNLFVPLWFFSEFYPFIPALLFSSIFDTCHLSTTSAQFLLLKSCGVFTIFYSTRSLCLSLSGNGTFRTLLHITLSYQYTYLFLQLIEPHSMREAALIPSVVMIVLCINSWILGTKFISLQSQTILHYQLETTL